MNSKKSVQMPECFFVDVFKLILALNSIELPDEVQTIADRIEGQISAKFERMERREKYRPQNPK